MRITRFEARDVHGYLDFDIKFHTDLNFLAGLNGSGKTTILKMIVALLTPSFFQLKEIEYSSSTLTLIKDGDEITITTTKSDEKVSIATNAIDGEASQYYAEVEPDDERKLIMLGKRYPVVKFLYNLPSPMFLSLDRRFIKDTRHESEMILWSHEDFKMPRRNFQDEALNEVLSIVSDVSGDARARQLEEDKRLRNKIILDSFSLNEINRTKMPDGNTVRDLREKKAAIKKTLDTLDILGDGFQDRYSEFFTRLEGIIENLASIDVDKTRKDRNLRDRFETILAEWFINQSQLQKINKLFFMVEQYQKKKKEIYAKLVHFKSLVNKFFNQTGKKIEINGLGEMKIIIKNESRELSVLSSGERQILIMLAHLSLNNNLPDDGIFIVDEPELSLHLSWQDMFVEAIQATGKSMQIILATHSPAIIAGRNKKYVPVNGGI